MARSLVFRFGPGSLESLDLRVWSRNRTYGAVLCARVEGTFRVYCGAGSEHTVEISERLEAPRASAERDETAAWLVAARDDRSEDAACELAHLLVNYALEDWSDPCSGPDDDDDDDPGYIMRPHRWSLSGARCTRTGCNVVGTGDPIWDGDCEGTE